MTPRGQTPAGTLHERCVEAVTVRLLKRSLSLLIREEDPVSTISPYYWANAAVNSVTEEDHDATVKVTFDPVGSLHH